MGQIYFDLFLYGGNRSKIYYLYINRYFKGQIHWGGWQGMLGLVTQSANSRLPEFSDKSLNFGTVVPAPFIRETINMLPANRREQRERRTLINRAIAFWRPLPAAAHTPSAAARARAPAPV